MKIQEYIKELQELAEKYPNAILIYAMDNEGNSHDRVVFSPSVGYFDRKYLEWTPKDNFDEEIQIVNAICIN